MIERNRPVVRNSKPQDMTRCHQSELLPIAEPPLMQGTRSEPSSNQLKKRVQSNLVEARGRPYTKRRPKIAFSCLFKWLNYGLWMFMVDITVVGL